MWTAQNPDLIIITTIEGGVTGVEAADIIQITRAKCRGLPKRRAEEAGGGGIDPPGILQDPSRRALSTDPTGGIGKRILLINS